MYKLIALFLSNLIAVSLSAAPFVTQIGGSNDDGFRDIIETSDGFLACGYTSSTDGDISNKTSTDKDVLLVKLSKNGEKQWLKIFGGSGNDVACRILPLTDTSWVVFGTTESTNGIFSNYHANGDYFSIQLTNSGKILYPQAYGTDNEELLNTAAMLADKRFILSGYTNNGTKDFYTIVLGNNLQQESKMIIGMDGYDDYGTNLIPTPDSGVLVTGSAKSPIIEGISSSSSPYSDFVSIKYSKNFKQEWGIVYGGQGHDFSFNGTIMSDGSFLIGGTYDISIKRRAVLYHLSPKGELLSESIYDTAQHSIGAIVPVNTNKQENYLIVNQNTNNTAPLSSFPYYQIYSLDENHSLLGTVAPQLGKQLGVPFQDSNGNLFTYSNTEKLGNNTSKGGTDAWFLPIPLVTIDSIIPESQKGTSNAKVYLTAKSAVGIKNLLWSNGRTTQNLLNTTAGSYSLTITDNNNIQTIVKTTVPQQLNCNPVVINPSSSTASDGQIRVNVSGGTAPYTYHWQPNNSFNDVASSLQSGNYSVTVTDANKQTIHKTFHLSTEMLISIDSIHEASNTKTNDGFIKISVSGGIMPYRYAWSNGKTDNLLTNLTDGVYTVTVTDAAQQIFTKQIKLCAGLLIEQDSLFKSKIDSVCILDADNTIHLYISGGEIPYRLILSDSIEQKPQVTALTQKATLHACVLKVFAPGYYALQVTDSAGRQKSRNFLITHTLLVDTQIVRPSAKGKFDGKIVLAVSGGIAPYNYVWSDNSNMSERWNMQPGNYTCTVTDQSGQQRIITCNLTPIAYSLQGSVLATNNVLPLGYIVAFSIENNRLAPVAADTIDSYGRFNFKDKLSIGTYILQLLPQNFAAELRRPTYFFRKTTPNQAHQIKLMGAVFGVQLEALPYTTYIKSGKASVQGRILNTDSAFAHSPFFQDSKNYPVYLYQNDSLIGWTLTQTDGYYSFNNLPAGKYQICCITPVMQTATISFSVSEYAGTLMLQAIDIGTPLINEDQSVTIFPNPASDYINFSNTTEHFQAVSIVDIFGTEVLHTQWPTSCIDIQLLKKQQLYYIRLQTQTGYVSQCFFKE